MQYNNSLRNGGFPRLQLCVVSCYCALFVFWVLTSSQVSRGSQVGKVIQADDVNDGADHTRMVLHGRRQADTLSLRQLLDMIKHI